MMPRTGWVLLSAILVTGLSSGAYAVDPDAIDVRLSAPADKVKQALIEVLTTSGYEEIVWTDPTTLSTGFRQEFEGPWHNMYLCCWGVIKSRVEATVTPVADQATALHLKVLAQGKRTLWEGYIPVETPVPESAANQLRLIKNKLKIVSHPYTTQSFFSMK